MQQVISGHWIGGQEVASASKEFFECENPTLGQPEGRFALGDEADVGSAVAAATSAILVWNALSPTRRGRLLMRWGDLIGANAERIGKLETSQNGKLANEMVLQARSIVDWLYYYGGLADKIEGRVIPLDRSSVLNYTLREPLGVVGVIMPWNSPLMLAIMAIAPALAAGNTVILKPSEVTPASAIEAAKLAEQAGIPPGVVNVVTGTRDAAEQLTNHPGVAKIAFTGGVEAGRAVAVATARRLAHSTLELGGKSANIVFPDANLKQAEAGLLAGIFAAAGQTCVAGSRALIHRSLHDQVVEILVNRAKQIKVGDPLDPTTQMGPIATRNQLKKNESMVQRAVQDGASLAFGGVRNNPPQFPNGFFFSPTILTGVRPQDYIAQNEVFGPVLSIIPFDDDEEAISIANGTEFGLAAGVWTTNLQRAHRMARRLQAGTVWVNMYRAMTFNSPFGGTKSSGIGRQNGMEAIDQYLQTKSVWCELDEAVQDPFVLRT
ncbi:aldehyde dehydrogenase [Pararhizobium sp. YC-54]|uniref:aldehyde dehydrogenase n=1 Tax=Pararhizobium sp. YC-54 TaxID=2986920 RepID=UPI0021F70F2F|nr:aldehyde dehydrogenase [Pararhizobium sp. YC-54]MCW0002134.1 aldehyde dehydrogenase [Pararhizobium sp. YC-54]